MLVVGSHLINLPILSLQMGRAIAWIKHPIVDPDSLKIVGFITYGGPKKQENILDVKSVREYSQHGLVVDSEDELVASSDIISIQKVLDLRFDIVGLKVESRYGRKMGRVDDYTVTDNDFVLQQIIVKRPSYKGFWDPELTIPRKEIKEVTDTKIIVKDDEKTIRDKAENEDFVPNFVNPFRKKSEPDYVPAESQNPDEQDN